ncbi:MAG TPA: hypothetical protein VK764_09610 [Terracidiphilus sp.]|jgi:hypothetical protein|nr:hypothetical protein [Terracidiphilus sp.]
MYLECRHILPRGTKCKAPALRGKFFCYFHDKLRLYEQDGQRVEREPLFLPSLEDTRGIQMAIGQILAALGSGRIDTRQAGLYLYGLQLATQLAARQPDPLPQEMVRATTCDGGGNAIGAQDFTCDPYLDCATCTTKDRCHVLPFKMRGVAELLENMRRRQDDWEEVKELSRKMAAHEITIEEVFARNQEKKGEAPSLDAPDTEKPRALPLTPEPCPPEP